MRSFFLSLLTCYLLLLAGQVFGQDTTASERRKIINASIKEEYLKKSERKKQAAQILLISGAALTIGGVFVASGNSDNIFSLLSNIIIGGFMMTAGITSCLVSIPFFIRSSALKKKAASITLQPERITMPGLTTGKEIYTPTVSIKIPL